MEKRFYYIVFLLLSTWSLQAKIIYVQAGNNGNGTSWQTAKGDLQEALRIAQNGDQIWVAKGVYYPTTDNNRTISFQLKDGVALYGSFAGFETLLEERLIKTNYSVLSGEIGTEQKTDNTFNVLYSEQVTKTTIIDGFIITGGFAGDDDASGARFASGGGLYHLSTNKATASNPTIRNCRFIENTARDGGAIYNNAANGGNCQPNLINCIFQDNTAFLGGGAIFNNGMDNGNCSPTITENKFTNNTAGFGGAIFNYGQNGKSIATIFTSEFANNKAMIQGGGIYNLGGGGISESKLTNCHFTENKAPKGSTVANSKVLSTKKMQMPRT